MARDHLDSDLAAAHALVVLFSPDSNILGKVYRLPRRRYEIGRTPTPPGLTVEDRLVSRVHASIAWDPSADAYVLADEGSLNKTYLQGEEVTGPRPLEPGDIIRFGDTVCRFSRLDMAVVGWSAPRDSLFQGRSLALRLMLDQARHVAVSDLTVLIIGDTGTGKERLAREIHRLSGRRGQFVRVNCAALSPVELERELFGFHQGAFPGAVVGRTGAIQRAHSGTLLLDEADSLPPTIQAKLLSVLDEKTILRLGATVPVEVDVRFLACSRVSLSELTKTGSFRADLFARLGEWQIRVPDLVERIDDLGDLLEDIIAEYGKGKAYDLSADFFEALAIHPWPYNVRELVSLVRKAMASMPDGGLLGPKVLPDEMRLERVRRVHTPARRSTTRRHSTGPRDTFRPDKALLSRLLAEYEGDVTSVAERLGTTKPVIYALIGEYELDPDNFRRRQA